MITTLVAPTHIPVAPLTLRYSLVAILLLPVALVAQSSSQSSPQGSSPPTGGYLQVSATTQRVAEGYASAYFAKRWDDLEKLADSSLAFSDPTAQLIGGGQGRTGLRAVMDNFRKGYADITLSFARNRAWFSGHYAIFEGRLTWSNKLADGRAVGGRDDPFVLILRVDNGRVVEHRDYADYRKFVESLRTPRPPE